MFKVSKFYAHINANVNLTKNIDYSDHIQTYPYLISRKIKINKANCILVLVIFFFLSL